MSDQRRFFSQKERSSLYVAADGKSDLSGQPLPDNFHADHIVPYSKGGTTDVSNGQALTPEENMRKSDAVTDPRFAGLRGWQRLFAREWLSKVRADFMLAALPGGGKTRAALRVARWHLDKNPNARIVVVVPTSALREQWSREAKNHENIDLQTREFRGTLKGDFHGVVTTYAAVASNAILFRRLCSMHDVLVIFDEIHHAGDKSSWGMSIKEAFENATNRLAMSGTPFKTDGQKIPFLRVESDGTYALDFTYDYPNALKDGVVRFVSFHRYSGSVTLTNGDEILEFHTDDELDETDAGKRLRGLLRSNSFTKGLLTEAHHRLEIVRKSKPDAGALAICIDANHAVHVARLLEEITGEAPDIVVSDDDVATGSINTFRKSNKRWIVAVRMVSEGVDIKRLIVLSYLTNTTTELFFRQAVGRIVRSEGTDFDTEAYCFLPNDGRLVEHAEKIEEFQAHIIAEDDEHDGGDTGGGGGCIPQNPFQVLDASSPEFAGITIGGSHHGDERAKEIIELSNRFQIPENKLGPLYEYFKHQAAVAFVPAPHVEETKEEEASRLRRQIKKLVGQLWNKTGAEPKNIHAEYKRLANVAQDQMTIAQLKAKIEWLKKQLAS